MLVTHTAHDPDLERALTDAGCPVAHHPDKFYMWRVNLPEKLADRFGMTPAAASKYVFAKFGNLRSAVLDGRPFLIAGGGFRHRKDDP